MLRKLMWKDVLDSIKAIEKTKTIDETFVALKSFVINAGGSSLLLGQIVNPIISGKPIETYGRSDWPEDYLREWLELDYVIHDPITHLALRASGPFDWSEAHDQGTKFGKKVLDRAKFFGLTNGFSIPIRSDLLPLGIVSVGYNEKISTELIEFIEIVSTHAYVKTQSFKHETSQFLPTKLSKREVEILSYTAAGKTTWEISVILEIAETTVNSHVRNILGKLGSSNKTQAVIEGIRSGQIML